MSMKGQMQGGRFLDLNGICDICNKKRSTGSHARCSRIRKQRYEKLHD